MPKLILDILNINGVKTKGKVWVDNNVLTFELDSNPSEIETIDLPEAFCLECIDSHFVYEYPEVIHSNDRYRACRPRGWHHFCAIRPATSNESGISKTTIALA